MASPDGEQLPVSSAGSADLVARGSGWSSLSLADIAEEVVVPRGALRRAQPGEQRARGEAQHAGRALRLSDDLEAGPQQPCATRAYGRSHTLESDALEHDEPQPRESSPQPRAAAPRRNRSEVRQDVERMSLMDQPQASMDWGNSEADFGQAAVCLAVSEEERLKNLERYTRCLSVRFHRRTGTQEDRDLAFLMPESLSKSEDVWEYTSCAICLADFADGEQLRRAPCNGGHVFHPHCLRGWMERSHVTCPTCRGSEFVDRQPKARPTADALSEFVIRRMRSKKVELSVTAPNKRAAAQIVKRMREPAPTYEEHSAAYDSEGLIPLPERGEPQLTAVERARVANAAVL